VDHLFVLVTYDVETTTADGKRRLREVAKICMNYGQRVQNSVFECLVDPLQYKQLKTKLMKIIDEERDSLRFYNIGSKWKRKVEHVGAKPSYDPEGLLLIE
jgi:CRISPR-associated protein Cas2